MMRVFISVKIISISEEIKVIWSCCWTNGHFLLSDQWADPNVWTMYRSI